MTCTRCGSTKHSAPRCPLNVRRMALAFAACLAVIVAGCSTLPTKTSGIRPPSARLMVAPKPLPEIKDGDDLVEKIIEHREDGADDKARLESLQGYVKTLLRK